MGRLWSTWLLVLAFPHSGRTLETSYSTKILSDPISVRNNFADCLLTIIRDPSLDFMVSIGIHIETESSVLRQEFTDTVDRFIAFNDRVAMYLGSVDGSNVQGRIYFVDSLKSFETLVKRYRKGDTDISGGRQYYLVILPADVKKPKRLMKQIFRFCWNESIVNVNILVGDRYGVVSLFTYYPFTAKSCADHTPTIHNRFTDGSFESNKPIFPSKTSNLWHCPVISPKYSDPPHTTYKEDDDHGLLPDSYHFLAKGMNSSYASVISPGGRGDVYSNGSSTASFRMLQDGSIDILTAVATETRFKNLATTNVVYYMHLRLIIKRDDVYSPMEILLSPFDWYTWIALAILFIIKWIVHLLWRRFRNRPVVPSLIFMRCSAMFWLFTTLIVSSSYEGSIFKFLHSPPSKPLPKTIAEAIEQDYTFVVSSFQVSYLRQISEFKNRIIERAGPESETFKFFNQLEGKYGYAYWEDFFNYYLLEVDPAKRGDYFVVPEAIATYPVLYFMQKFSYLSAEVNKQVQQMYAHGHYVGLWRTYVPKLITPRKKKHADPESMSLHQLYGGVQIFYVLIVISTLVFVMELLATHSRRLRVILEVFE